MPQGDVDLPNWTIGHKVKSSGETQQGGRPGSDVDLPDWAPGHKVPSRYSGSHPGQAEREESYHWAQDASRDQDAETPPDARHDKSARWDPMCFSFCFQRCSAHDLRGIISTDTAICRKQDASTDGYQHGDVDRDVDWRTSPAPSSSLHLPGISAAVKAAAGSRQVRVQLELIPVFPVLSLLIMARLISEV